MASEDRTELFGILFVRSEAFQILAGPAASVIQQDAGERSAALWAPKHRVQGSRPTVDDYGFRPARRLAPGRRDCERQYERRQDGRIQPCHMALPQPLDGTHATDVVGIAKVYLKLRPQ